MILSLIFLGTYPCNYLLKKNSIFIRASILDIFSLLYKDVLFVFYHNDNNLIG